VVKTQFERNAPSRLFAADPVLAAARATGRYVELSAGTHRNNVFPVEAALAADLCVGHLIGATASLEAALGGVRSIMLNPLNLRTTTSDVYARADIVYSSMEAALEAIGAWRRGDPTRAALGDWSSIVRTFDPFGDGNASRRLRELLERAVVANEPLGPDHSMKEAS